MFTKPTKVALACAATFATIASAHAQTNSEFNPVVISASRFEDQQKDLYSDITIISKKEIMGSGLTNLTQVLSKLGGIATRSSLNGSSDSQLVMRAYGVNADNNMVIQIDGARLSDNEQNPARLFAIPVDIIERIEIVRGGSSVLFGEGAVAGVVNIVTSGKVPDQAYLSAELGSYNSAGSTAYVSNNFGDVSLNVSGKTLNTDHARNNNRSQERSGSMGVSWKSGGDSLKFQLIVDEQKSRFPGSLSYADFMAGNYRKATTPNDFGSVNGDLATLSYLGKRDSIDFIFDISTRNRSSFAYMSSSNTYTDRHQQQYSPRIRFNEGFFGKDKVILGADLINWQYRYHSPQYWLGDQLEYGRQRNEAVFFSHELNLDLNHQVTYGVRRERVQQNLSDTLFGNQSLTAYVTAWDLKFGKRIENVNAHFKVGKNFRVSNVDDRRNPSYSIGDNGTPSDYNDDIYTPTGFARLPTLQQSIDYEVGISSKSQQLDFSMVAFRSNVNNEIAYDPNTYLNINYDPTYRQGVEGKVRYALNNRANIRSSLVVQEAKFRSGQYSGNNLPLVPNYLFGITGDYQISQRQRIDLTFEGVGSQRFDADYRNLDAHLMPTYFLTNMRWSQVDKKYDLIVSLNNIFDKKYYSYGVGNASGSNRNVYPNYGRNATVQARVFF
jgi:iron complex outermembrane recepter protein